LHYDFRLELDGVLMSWAVPKGPSFDPKERRIAVRVEDHPVSYGGFEGSIPPKQYGAGTVIVWDQGTWEPVGDPREGMVHGKVLFKLHGHKLAGLWELVRIAKPADKQDLWILFKKRDVWARPLLEYDVIAALPDSVITSPLGPVEDRERREAAKSVVTPPSAAQADLSLAKKAKLPAALAPQLASLATALPSGPGWTLEPKWDGYRILARIDRGAARLITRNGNDWTDKMSSLARAVETLGIDSAWLDGEIVVLDEKGVPSFNALQKAVDVRRNDRITYFVFDAPFFDGQDLRKVPLGSRRALLRKLFEERGSDRVRFSPDFDAPPAQMLEAACAMRLEGIMAKRTDAPYVSARSDTWLKLKCMQRQEFVVVGFTDRAGAATEVGGLMLAYNEHGRLQYAGNVGTGWSSKTGQELHAALTKLRVNTPAIDPATVQTGRWSKRAAGSERWVKPQMVVEVSFSEWTPDQHVRQPSFKGVRTDKVAAEITREVSSAPLTSPSPAAASVRGRTPFSTKVSHPERVVDPTTGLTKLELVRYYESIAKWILPHLANRPVALVRGPEGITGQLFFQKHAETALPGFTVLDAKLWPGHAALLAVNSARALMTAAQMNVIEFHTWNSTDRNINKPDRMIFDLDPGEGVSWAMVQEAATLTRAMLDALGLDCWLKTSGGKGLHVVVPLAPRLDCEVVKGLSQAVVQHMAKTIPQRFVAKSGGSNRIGKVFIDYLRNGYGQTTATAFSARSRPGLGVSMPVSWDQLSGLKSGAQWTIATAREHLSFEVTDPWKDYWTRRQSLGSAMKALGYSAK
jgi:bifunctional non-homologous end joining protein LigD